MGAERRRYFRVADQVALEVRELQPQELAEQLEGSHTPELTACLPQRLIMQREQLLPWRQRIERQYPEVAEYLAVLEGQLANLTDLVYRLIQELAPPTPAEATHAVDLSAQGIRFRNNEPFGLQAAVELKLTLFPERLTLYILATVVDCNMQDDGNWDVALDFEFIGDDEREALIKHVNNVQMASLQQAKRQQGESAAT